MVRITNFLRNLIGSDMLWALVILAGFVFITSLVPLPPNDYWWHLRIGEVISREHAIPTTNVFSWAVPSDQPFFYSAWLGEYILYSLHRIGGLELNIFLRNVLVGIAFWLVGFEARRQSNSWRIAAFVMALACLMSVNNLALRPQTLAFIPFILIYVCLKRYTSGNTHYAYLLACLVIMIFWINLHGSFIIGLGILTIFFIGEVSRSVLKLGGALPRRYLSWLGGLTLTSFLAILINPRFTEIVSYLKILLTNKPIQDFIEEWQPPTTHGLANIVFFISILILIFTLSLSRTRFTPSEMLLTMAFIWLAWQSQRSVIWYGIVVMPILGKMISGVPYRGPIMRSQKNVLNLFLVILIFIPGILAQPWFFDWLPLPTAYLNHVQNDAEVGPLLDNNTPTEVARYLRKHPEGRMFNELGYGSYFIWAVPDVKVFIDPRIELYPSEMWNDYINISNGVQSLELLDKYSVNRVALNKSIQPGLSSSLAESVNWELEYQDSITEIWTLNLIP